MNHLLPLLYQPLVVRMQARVQQEVELATRMAVQLAVEKVL